MDDVVAIENTTAEYEKIATYCKNQIQQHKRRALCYQAILISQVEKDFNLCEQGQVEDLLVRIDDAFSTPMAPSEHEGNGMQAPTASGTHEDDEMQALTEKFDNIFTEVQARQKKERSQQHVHVHAHASPQNETEHGVVGIDDGADGAGGADGADGDINTLQQELKRVKQALLALQNKHGPDAEYFTQVDVDKAVAKALNTARRTLNDDVDGNNTSSRSERESEQDGASSDEDETSFAGDALNASQSNKDLTSDDDESSAINEELQRQLYQAKEYAKELQAKLKAQAQEFEIKTLALHEEISTLNNAAADTDGNDTDGNDTDDNDTDGNDTDGNDIDEHDTDEHERKVACVIKMQAWVRRFIGQRIVSLLKQEKIKKEQHERLIVDVEHMMIVIDAAYDATSTPIEDRDQLKNGLLAYMRMSGDVTIEGVRKNEIVINQLVQVLHELYGRCLEERQKNDKALVANFHDIGTGGIGALLAYWQQRSIGKGTSTEVSKLIQLCGKYGKLRMFLLVQLKAGFDFFNNIFVLLNRNGDFLKIEQVGDSDGNGTREKMIDYLMRKRFDPDEQMLSDSAKKEIDGMNVEKLAQQCRRKKKNDKQYKKMVTAWVANGNAKTLKDQLKILCGGDTYTQLFQTVICGNGSSFVLNNWKRFSCVWEMLDANGQYYTKAKMNNRKKTIECFLRWMNLHPDNLVQKPPLSYYQSTYSTVCKMWVSTDDNSK